MNLSFHHSYIPVSCHCTYTYSIHVWASVYICTAVSCVYVTATMVWIVGMADKEDPKTKNTTSKNVWHYMYNITENVEVAKDGYVYVYKPYS